MNFSTASGKCARSVRGFHKLGWGKGKDLTKKKRNGRLHDVISSRIIFDIVENWVYELKVPSGILTCQWYLLSTSLTLVLL